MSYETKKVEDGGSAFPDIRNAIDWKYQPGMTLRDYFAAMTLQGHLANESTVNHPSFDRDSFVNECYVMADAMIERRKR